MKMSNVTKAYIEGYFSSFNSRVSSVEMQDALRAIPPENIAAVG